MHQEAHTESPPKTTGMAPRNRLKHIALRVQATIGAEFFESLVKNLAEALEADCVYVGEFVGGKMERVRTVASWVNGKPGDAFEYYTLAGGVAAQVAVRNIACIRVMSGRSFLPMLLRWIYFPAAAARVPQMQLSAARSATNL